MHIPVGEKRIRQIPAVFRKSGYPLLAALGFLLLPLQVVKANPVPLPTDIFLNFFLKNIFLMLLMTVGIEFVVILRLGSNVLAGQKFRVGKIFLVVAVLNLVSFPTLLFIIKSLPMRYYLNLYCVDVPILEFLVVAVEAIAYKLIFRMPLRQAFKLSFLANVVSFFAGFLISNALYEDPYSLNDIEW